MSEMDKKKKCEELRKVRLSVAEKIGLDDNVRKEPCSFKGECKGTCPACEREEKLLSKALLTGTAVACSALMLAGCAKDTQTLSGDVEYKPEAEIEDASDSEVPDHLTGFVAPNDNVNDTEPNRFGWIIL